MQRRKRANGEFLLIGGILAAIIVLPIFIGIVVSATRQPAARPTPTPAPSGPQLLVNLVNQRQSLNVMGSYAFDVTTRTLRITYLCTKPGHINFAVAPMDQQMPDLAWAKQVTCPASGQDVVHVVPGTYSLDANDIGDENIGWGITIMEE